MMFRSAIKESCIPVLFSYYTKGLHFWAESTTRSEWVEIAGSHDAISEVVDRIQR